MVIHLIYLFVLLPFFLISGEFTATVSRNQMNLGDSITLNLTLRDASAKSFPSVESLKKSFSIHSQQQMANTVMKNGKITSSTTWKLTLIPHKEGEAVIPSLSIDTSDGILSSEPIAIRVNKGAATAGELSDNNEVILTTDLNNAKPYKNEPVFYTIKMVSKRDLVDIKMEKIELDNAIAEMNGEPKIYKKVVDGIYLNIIEIDFLITPLKAGPLKIPSVVVQGFIPLKRNIHNGPFSDDDLDPFSMMMGFHRLKPFALATEETILDVQPAVAGIEPWLPARSLKIEEIWNDSQSLQVGEPLTRSFKIVAEGIKASQLPSLNDLQISESGFKIYADKPELGDEGKEGSVKSYRKEQYTLIPQQAGELTLPELSLVWWDVTKNEKAVVSIPSRTLQILPAPETLKSKMAPAADETHSVSNLQGVVTQQDPIAYSVIAGLAILLLVAIFWVISLQKKIRRYKEAAVPLKTTDPHEISSQHPELKSNPSRSDKREKLPDLNPT